jgi:hypothetical protein
MTRRNPGQARQHGDLPAQLSLFRRGQLVGPGDRFVGLGDQVLADSGITDRSVGVVADHESVGGASDSYFPDLQVPGSLLVAALPRQRRLHVRGSGAQFLPDDVAAGAPSRNRRLFAEENLRVSDPDDLAEEPVPHVLLDLPDQRRVRRTPSCPAVGASHPALPRGASFGM